MNCKWEGADSRLSAVAPSHVGRLSERESLSIPLPAPILLGLHFLDELLDDCLSLFRGIGNFFNRLPFFKLLFD